MDGSICRKHNCHLCCLETEMELTGADVRRLENEGYKGFYQGSKTIRTLRNRDGRCFFLDADNLCSVYRYRPMGCRSYPLMMELETYEGVLDELCPHADEFTVDPEDMIALHTIIGELEARG